VCFVDCFALAIWMCTSASSLPSESRYDLRWHLIQSVNVLGVAGTLFVVYSCWHAWRNPSQSILGKLSETLILFSCFGYIALVWNWNMFSFGLQY
jgi:hypothetical protein